MAPRSSSPASWRARTLAASGSPATRSPAARRTRRRWCCGSSGSAASPPATSGSASPGASTPATARSPNWQPATSSRSGPPRTRTSEGRGVPPLGGRRVHRRRWSGGRGGADQAGLVGEHDELSAVAGAELDHGAADMGPRGCRAEGQLGGDLVVAEYLFLNLFMLLVGGLGLGCGRDGGGVPD